MSSQITTAFVQQYRNEVFHLSQQRGSRFQDKVRRETQNSKTQFFDRIGSVSARKVTTRHADTPQIDTPHSRRAVTLVDYDYGDLLDKEDKRRLLMDPSGEYAQAAMWALGRAKDDEIIDNADADVLSGENGNSTTSHPDSQKYAYNDGSNFTDLKVNDLRAVRKIFWDNDVDEEAEPMYAAVRSDQLESLLGETEVTSSDYNTVRSLVQGEMDTFMGFQFVRSQRLNNVTASLSASKSNGSVGSGSSVTGNRKNIFWQRSGLLLSTAEDIEARIEERNDKRYSTQVYVSMGIGSARMEEEKVVIGIADES